MMTCKRGFPTGSRIRATLVGLIVMILATPASAGPTQRTFAEAFFIARRANGDLEVLGSVVIWFLLAMSVFGIGLIVSMAVANRRHTILPGDVVKRIGGPLKAGQYEKAIAAAEADGSYFGRVLSGGLKQAPHGYEAIIRGLEQVAVEETTIRFRRIELLNVLGQVSPMIGLFGTVYGMILAFSAIVASGGAADPVMLAGGIGTALTTTFWGLVVAIPALAGYALLRNRIDELTIEATLQAEEFVAPFRPAGSTAEKAT
ncbi:MAG: MotA/TolQ/ExbB proton channel family protein [Planctomycetota bacterium]|nr:MotA/TolQ/ExbB proton channel family protein [Planctomycetota bacterium]